MYSLYAETEQNENVIIEKLTTKRLKQNAYNTRFVRNFSHVVRFASKFYKIQEQKISQLKRKWV